LKPIIIIAIAIIFATGIGFSLNATAEEGLIPSWIKTTAGFWVDGQIGDSEFLQAIEFLSNQGMIKLESTSSNLQNHCLGNAGCIPGIVTQVIDGDTIKVYGKSVRFVLGSAPELDESGGEQARTFIEKICPVGSSVLVDEDDMNTQASYGRILGVVYCNDMNLNEELVKSGNGVIEPEYCSDSEFSQEDWAVRYGCDPKPSCDESYPDVCIPAWPPDLDCGEIEYRNFKTIQPDKHRFDPDKDGIGCES